MTAAWKHAIATGEPYENEHRLRRSDGEYRWFQVRAVADRDGDGQIIRWPLLITDVDDRKRAEDLLRASEQQLRVIVDSIPGLVVLVNASSGELELVNQAVLDYFGRNLEELQQWGSSDSVHPDDLPRVIAAWQHAIATGEPPEWVHRLRRSDGVYRWHQLRGFPWRDSSNRVVRWYCLITDIHEHWLAATELQRASQALHEMQTKLSRAAQVATVGEMAASIAHEVNQPLAAVVANGHACVRWLTGTPPNVDKALEAAERIVKDGKDAGDVVRRVRSLFRRATAERVPLDLGDVIRDVIRLVEADAAKRNVDVGVTLEPGVPPVRGDRVQLQQVVLNLMLNALDAVEPVVDRRKQVMLRTRRCDDAHVMVEVADNGVGLEEPSAVFEPFFTTKPNGMGMGLAICRSIVSAHDGTLAAARNDDFGTTFWFALPVEPGA